jgi:DNA modification methylase
MKKVLNQEVKENYAVYNGDSCEAIKNIPDNSIGYCLYSPPFADLYCYSNSECDMGNSKNYDEFFQHFEFLARDLFRVMQKGRVMSVHCIDIPAMKERDGYIGLKDFPGDLIRLFQKVGFIYHSRVTIWKNPLIEATRTKAIGLMHKQLCKDSAMCRQGLPDYIISFRKAGDNEKPISRQNGFERYIGEDMPEEKGVKFSHETWRHYASPVWMDINQTRVLEYRGARENEDEKHICPLQLDTIERCIELWSKEGDTFLTPFMGIGSEVYSALKMKRKAIGIELKESYYNQALRNIQSLKIIETQTTIFEGIENAI